MASTVRGSQCMDSAPKLQHHSLVFDVGHFDGHAPRCEPIARVRRSPCVVAGNYLPKLRLSSTTTFEPVLTLPHLPSKVEPSNARSAIHDGRATLSFTAVFLKCEGGYVGFVEEIPAVNSHGRTLDVARRTLVELTRVVFDEERRSARELLAGKEALREPFFAQDGSAERARRRVLSEALQARQPFRIARHPQITRARSARVVALMLGARERIHRDNLRKRARHEY